MRHHFITTLLLGSMAGFGAFGCADGPSNAANRELGAPPPNAAVKINNVLADGARFGESPVPNGADFGSGGADELQPGVESNDVTPGSTGVGAASCNLDDVTCICEGLIDVAQRCGNEFGIEEGEVNISQLDKSICSRPGIQAGFADLCSETENEGFDCAFLIEIIGCISDTCGFETCAELVERRFDEQDSRPPRVGGDFD